MNACRPKPGTSELPSTFWCLAQTKPNGEGMALRNLLRQGFGIFAPRIGHTARARGRFRNETRPLFPGYIFVSVHRGSPPWRAISGTTGVSRLVSFRDDRPAVVPDELVALLRRRCEDPDASPSDDLRQGEAVRITSGPFADFIGNIESVPSTQRMWILLDILGGAQRVSVDVRVLERADC